MSRTWRDRTYPNKGHDAASLVWSKAPRIVRTFDEGAAIKSKPGFWLAIPTPSAPKRGVGGAFTKTGRMKQGMATSVMFIMVPRVGLKKRLDVKREIKRWERRLPGLIDRHMPLR